MAPSREKERGHRGQGRNDGEVEGGNVRVPLWMAYSTGGLNVGGVGDLGASWKGMVRTALHAVSSAARSAAGKCLKRGFRAVVTIMGSLRGLGF